MNLGEVAEGVVWGTVAALLPEEYRRRIIKERGIDGARASLALGLLEGGVGLGLYMAGYLAFIGGYGAAHQMLLLEYWNPSVDGGDLHFSGIFGFFAWHMFPQAWVFMYFALTGLVRCITYLAIREAIGEPVVALAIWLVGGTRRRVRDRSRERRLGALEPDRLIPSPPGEGCDLMVVSCRDKPAWNDRVAIEVEDRHYQLVRSEERYDGEQPVVCFLLREMDDSEVLRGLVSWETDPLNPANYTPPDEGS